MRKKLTILVTICCLATAYATDYYVDASLGNDSNVGTSSAVAWKTLSKVNLFTFLPGDRLLFKAGEVWNGQLLLNDSGTSGNPIILDMYGSGNKPIINGGGALTNNAATVLLDNVEYWEINNLELTNTNGTTTYQGDLWAILGVLDIAGGMEANHIYIRNCYIHDVNGEVATKTTGGIYMTALGTDPSRYNDLRIENNVIDNVGGLGIANQSSHASITSNTRYPSLNIVVRGNIVSNTGRNNVIIRASDGAIAEHNTLINSSRHDTGHSIFCFNTDGILIQYNEAYGNKGAGSKDRGAYDADYNCKNTKIQYNYSHDNHWGFAIMKRAVNENVVIRYNISENDDKAIYFYGFESRTGMTRASFYNNTHYVKSGIQLSIFGSGDIGRTAFNTDFYNNIFYFEDEGSDWGSINSNVDFKNNCFYHIDPQGTDYITLEPMMANPGAGEQDIDWSNYPNVLTGYKLQVGSPAIEMGISITDNGGQDFWGTPLYVGDPDIGACEFPGDPSNNIPTDITLSSSSIQENNVANAIIGIFSSTDADATDPAYFHLVGGTGSEDNASFGITDVNKLIALSSFDYELKSSYSIRVRTTDGRGGAFEKAITIIVTDQNPESSVTILSSDDAYVRGGSHSGTNYGSEDFVEIKESTNASFTRRGYLKFDISQLSIVQSASLLIYGSAQQVMDLSIYSVTNDSWQEGTLTWDNAPSLVSNAGTVSMQLTDQWYSVDITALVQNELAGDSILSIGLKDDNTLVKNIDLYSKENGTGNFKAYLSVEEANIQNIIPQEDALIRDGSHADSNFGTDTELMAKLASSNFTRESYLKFDVSSLATTGTIFSAKLILEPTTAGTDAALTQIEVKKVDDDTWSELGITWNNKPTQGAVLDSQTGSATTMEWDITAQVQAEVLGDGILSLALSSTVAGGQHFVTYNSKEATDLAVRPKLVVAAENAPGQGEKDIFLVIGQSNTAGRATIEAKDLEILSNVYLLNADGDWEAAANPLNKYSTIRKDISVQKLGYAYTFGRHLQAILSEDIGLVVNARGGSNINEWQKGASANYYGEALARIQTSMSIPGSNLKGILWHQGESNRNDGLSYITKLQSIINDFRVDLNLPDLPLIAGQISQERPENEDFNTNVIPTLPTTVLNTDYVKSDYLHAFDLTHFDSEAQRVLGGRYAAKILEQVYNYQIVTDTIWVDEDSYVRGGANADNNYNAQSVLRVKTNTNPDFTRESFLKFDLSGVSDQIIDAILVVNGSASEGGSLNPTFYETSDTWSESTITWNNKPAAGNELEILPVSGTNARDYEVFLSEFAQETQKSDGILSITIKDNGTTGKQFRFKSKEDSANQALRPYLLVTKVINNAPVVSIREVETNTSNAIPLKDDIILFPNPVSETLYFKNLSDVQKINVISMNGRVVVSNLDTAAVENSRLNVSAFQKGIYIVAFLKKDGDIVSKKVLIQ